MEAAKLRFYLSFGSSSRRDRGNDKTSCHLLVFRDGVEVQVCIHLNKSIVQTIQISLVLVRVVDFDLFSINKWIDIRL